MKKPFGEEITGRDYIALAILTTLLDSNNYDVEVEADMDRLLLDTHNLLEKLLARRREFEL